MYRINIKNYKTEEVYVYYYSDQREAFSVFKAFKKELKIKGKMYCFGDKSQHTEITYKEAEKRMEILPIFFTMTNSIGGSLTIVITDIWKVEDIPAVVNGIKKGIIIK